VGHITGCEYEGNGVKGVADDRQAQQEVVEDLKTPALADLNDDRVQLALLRRFRWV